MIYVYAVTDRPQAPMPSVRGVHDEALVGRPDGDIGAVVSDLSNARVDITEENVLRHESVLEALMQERTVLPVRFGAVLPNEEALWQGLTAHRAACVADLERLKDKLEIGLRVLWEANPSRPPSPAEGVVVSREEAERGRERPEQGGGRAYLMARLQEERLMRGRRDEARTVATQLHAALRRWACEATWQLLDTQGTLLKAAYLIDRRHLSAFREAVNSLSASQPSLPLLCTGPWPPYSFVRAGFPAPEEETLHVLD